MLCESLHTSDLTLIVISRAFSERLLGVVLHYRFAISMRTGTHASSNAQNRTRKYEARFMNYYFEQIVRANVVARHKSEIGRKIWESDRGNLMKAIQMAESIPIREFELACK